MTSGPTSSSSPPPTGLTSWTRHFWRAGRFDRRVIVELPDVRGREAILKVHFKGKPVLEDLNVHTLAQQTQGFSGADLANLVNEAAILAARENKNGISLLDLEEAMDRVVAGPARKSRQISQREREIVAYHEAGHALVAAGLPNADPVHKVTIVPRGSAGGYTRMLPDETGLYGPRASSRPCWR